MQQHAPAMSVPQSPRKALPLCPLIQGGMGVAVSDWRLANAVSAKGQLGVVSGTALHVVFARRLADGDLSGDMRRALNAFPDQAMAQRVFDRWFNAEHVKRGAPYRQVPMFGEHPVPALEELNVVANFAEVYLAKRGHDGPVGINLLTKVQPPTLSCIYGAMLAGVDVVVMGAGVPAQIPSLLDRLAAGKRAELRMDVENVSEATDVRVAFDPANYGSPPLARPAFLAIVSSVVLANYLSRDETVRPDGFIVEMHNAGGHNAPPRSKSADGSVAFGKKDEIDLLKIAATGLPFWLAGGQASADSLRRAQEAGAIGVQVGTAFALCHESGLRADLKAEVLTSLIDGTLQIRTDMRASSSGFPFKVAEVAGTLADASVYERRERVCDLGLLRNAYERADGKIGYRCSAEPLVRFRRKGGDEERAKGRMCLCNGLLASAGLAQVHNGVEEPPLVTLGEDLSTVRALAETSGKNYTAADVIDWIMGG
jgi:NAD(P)H-dependent flavin oxidoreductase YrpB (nitropropane dioxygenase family)